VSPLAERSAPNSDSIAPGDLQDLLQRGYRFALSLTHSAQRAEELVQEAWFSVLKARGPWNRYYLFSAIRSRFVDECRRRNTVIFETLVEDIQGEADPADDPRLDDGFAVGNGALDAALERLRAEERTVLFLAAVEGCTAQEIADMLEWPRGTVLSMLHRTRKKLREQLQTENGVAT